MKTISIKKKIMFVVILAIIIAGFLATYGVFAYSKNVLMEKEKEIILVETLQVAHEIEIVLDQSKMLAKKIAGDDIIKNDLARGGKSLEKYISMHLDHYNFNSDFSEIIIVNKDGIAVSATNAKFIGQNYANNGFFQETKNEDENQVVAVIDDADKKLEYHIIQSIRNENGEFLGAVLLKLDSEIFKGALSLHSNNGHLNIMMADEYGIILFSDKEGRALKSLGAIDDASKKKIAENNYFAGSVIESIQYGIIQEKINNNIEEAEVFDFVDEVDNEDEILAFKKVGDEPFFIIAETNKEEHTKDAINIALFLSMFVGLAALVAGIFSYVSIGYQLSPLDRLHDLVLSAAKGNYLVRMDEMAGAGELSDLAKSFNVMIRNVRKSRKEIDKKVEEQTRDINNKKEELENHNLAILNILEDVESEKERTEVLAKDLEKFKLAVENASDHIVITDAEGIVLYANKAVEEITGYTNKEVLGKKAGNDALWGGQMKKDVYEKIWKIIKKDKKVFKGEFQNKRKNGEKYDASASITPILDENSKEVKFFVGIEHDITKENEIDKAKTEFVSLASHQLRTPLTAINWYVEMMLAGDAGKINKEQKSYLEEVYKGSKRMVDLVNALLNVSRIDLGTFAIDPEPTNFMETSKDVLNELKPSIIKKQMKIKESYDDKLPLINADPKLVRIIFQNLLSNAIKYTPEKGTISVKIKKDKTNVSIEISDNGYGIPVSQQSRIFEKLFRADNARERETDGTGLGLYVLRSIVEKNNGKIRFDSIENKGTTFYITMPLAGMVKKEGSKGLTTV